MPKGLSSETSAKNCTNCGNLYWGNPWQKLCPECRAANSRNGEYINERRADLVATKKRVIKKQGPVWDMKGCKECAYSAEMEGCICCDYILIKERRRPCPPGKGCTEFKKIERKGEMSTKKAKIYTRKMAKNEE